MRSFEKLTAGGMTFFDTDLIRVIEEVLPARFGGGPTDYQLVEKETADGRAHLRLLMDPALGPLDSSVVAEAFLTAIGRGSSTEHVMELHLRAAGLLQVERETPRSTMVGKVQHLHQEKRTST